MKQHITSDQLSELTEKGKERLVDWAGEHNDQHLSRKMTIGQMIEFLDGQGRSVHDKLEISHGLVDLKDTVAKAYGWNVKILDFNQGHGKLCDALWEATKEFLEK